MGEEEQNMTTKITKRNSRAAREVHKSSHMRALACRQQETVREASASPRGRATSQMSKQGPGGGQGPARGACR